MKMMATILLIFATTTASAEWFTAGQLYAYCTAKDEATVAACRFFILAAVQGYQMGDGAVRGPDGLFTERPKRGFCIAEDLPDSEVVATFEKSARFLIAKYPDDMKSQAVAIIFGAMVHAYPCANPASK